MSRFAVILYLPLILLMLSCGSGEQNMAVEQADEHKGLEEVQEEHQRRNNAPDADSLDFPATFNLFMKALQNTDTAMVNQFIHPDYGLWLIEQPGAMPRMTHVTDIRQFKREFQNRSFFTLRDEVKSCNLQQEAWPTFDCANLDYDAGRSGYSKDGCFAGAPDRFQKSGYWDYADLSDQEIQRVKAALPLLQKSVLHTATSFEFHFGQVDGHWRLLFAKLIYPCSA